MTTPGDSMPPPEHHQSVEKKNVQHGQLDEAAFFKRLMETDLEARESHATFVSNIGQIEQMLLPENWVKGVVYKAGIGGDLFQEYHPKSEPDVTMCFYYRGLRTSKVAGEIFHKVLQKSPHKLTEAEFTNLIETMRNKDPKDFAMCSAYTEDINGRRVLVVEGSFDIGKESQSDNRSIYVDADGSGTAVQEIYFQCPKEKFQGHIDEVNASLNSINWRYYCWKEEEDNR